MKSIIVTLEKSEETKGTYRFDSPDPNAAFTSVYVRKNAFDDRAIPKRIVLKQTGEGQSMLCIAA